jgi:hypothetical protein
MVSSGLAIRGRLSAWWTEDEAIRARPAVGGRTRGIGAIYCQLHITTALCMTIILGYLANSNVSMLLRFGRRLLE